MTAELWALYALASGAILLCVWAWATGGPGRLQRSRHVPEHGIPKPPIRTPLGPVAEWPWGQKPSPLMLAPDGVLVNAGPVPEEWMRRVMKEIDAGWYGRP